MIIVSILIVALLLLGLKLIFNITFKKAVKLINGSRLVLIRKYKAYKAKTKVPLKKQIDIMTGKRKLTLLFRIIATLRIFLFTTSRNPS